MIDVREVRMSYGRVEALREVSFRLEAGCAASLVGPSGSGKTTLLRIIAGLDLPDAGEVWLGGALVSRPGWGAPPHERGIGLEPLADRYPGELSGGEARRVALARALAPRPRVLLLDEPLTNLDGAARDQLLDLVLAAVRSSGCTLLYVTHQRDEARLVGGEVLELDAGQLAVRR